MTNLETAVLGLVSHAKYQPLKPKALARKLNVPIERYSEFRKVLKALLKDGRIDLGKNHLVLPAPALVHGAVTGIFRRAEGGYGFVRVAAAEGHPGQEIFIPAGHTLDAATGDEVVVRITRKSSRAGRGPSGQITQVAERATRQFVGTYFEREGQGLVRVDGTIFSHSVIVGDAGAKGARPDDKVVIEMLRFPAPEDRGEAVITEVLGKRGQPGVDTLSIIRAFGIPEEFPEAVLQEARRAAADFSESNLLGRTDFTHEVVVTIDPATARDFDDAVAVTIDPKTRHWRLAVHIADVGHFVQLGGELDREARKRGTSVYLPQRVIPMFPEIISNGLASLQQDRVRYVMSAVIDFTPAGIPTKTFFASAAIKNRRRFTYEEVSALLAEEEGHRGKRPSLRAQEDPAVVQLLLDMRDLALVLRKRRLKRGALELNMPEVDLEFDAQGSVTGAHYVSNDISHQMIEECMLAANEAVAVHLADLGVPFLRRIHPPPEPNKLLAFAEFVRTLGYKITLERDRFALQRVLQQSADRPDARAVHYALLRSLKQAAYSPDDTPHYALASDNYCHFTSPIRRYPDLTVHRLLDRWLSTGRCASDAPELAVLGAHCSRTERRADVAERELIKLKLLTYLSERIGLEMDAVITGVADYGFYCQTDTIPVDGLVHISTLTDDYYYFDERTHSLYGQRTKKRYRLGDTVPVKVVRVDLQRRQLDLRCAEQREPHGHLKKRKPD
jgi:ribonuclease R